MTKKARKASTTPIPLKPSAPILNVTAQLPTAFARRVKHFGVRIVVVSAWVAISSAAAENALLSE